jgi:hypothetical protein
LVPGTKKEQARPLLSPATGDLGMMSHTDTEQPMNDEQLNMSIRKFLKIVGVSSQREIEQAVARAIQESAIAGTETFPAKMTLQIPGLKLDVAFDGEIRLQ